MAGLKKRTVATRSHQGARALMRPDRYHFKRHIGSNQNLIRPPIWKMRGPPSPKVGLAFSVAWPKLLSRSPLKLRLFETLKRLKTSPVSSSLRRSATTLNSLETRTSVDWNESPRSKFDGKASAGNTLPTPRGAGLPANCALY